MDRVRTGALLALALAGATGALVGCPSPTQDAIIESLGPETPGVPESEFHRHGQPCLACHDAYGGDGPAMIVAGTVYATPAGDVTVAGARVELTDATGQTIEKPTNCAGNFFVEEGEWEPVWPLRVVVACTLPDGTVRRNVMGTRVNREGSCAGCHLDEPAGQSGPGRVYCVEVDEQLEIPFTQDGGCQGGPGAGG